MCSVFNKFLVKKVILFCVLNEQVSMGYGTITAHALMSLEARGTLFVSPGMEVVTN